jgi:integrase
MSAHKPTGIRKRHARTCKRKRDCTCPYEASVYLKREGKKLRKTFPNLAAAKAWRLDALGKAHRGELREPTRVTVAQAAEALLTGARDGSIPTGKGTRYKPSALRSYDETLGLHVLPAIGHIRLWDVRRVDVQAIADGMTAEGLSASTVHNAINPLRAIYRRAIRRDEFTGVDPTKGLELRRPDGRRDRIAAPEEAEALIAALPESERALWATALYAGLRRGELRALRVSRVDLPARVIRVERGWDDKEGEQDVKSAAAKRRVPILDVLAPILATHLLRTARSGDDLVFGKTDAAPFARTTVSQRALKAWGTVGLEPIGLHEARHTCASLMIAAGVNPKALSTIMGHATIAMTFDTYGHLMPGGLDVAAAATNAYLARLAGERPAPVVEAARRLIGDARAKPDS